MESTFDNVDGVASDASMCYLPDAWNSTAGKLGESDLLDPFACPPMIGEDDPDFKAFITREFMSEPVSQLSDSSTANGSFGTELHSGTESEQLAKEKLAHLQDYGLRSSPASTNRRKRKYSSMGDLGQLTPNMTSLGQITPTMTSLDTDSSDDSEVRKAPEIPASPHQQTKTTPLKRSASSGVACTLMPFSLIKAFPNQNSLSLSEVNRRIQTVVDNDAAAALRSQGSAGSLTSPRPNGRSSIPSIRVDHSDASQYSHSFASQPRFR